MKPHLLRLTLFALPLLAAMPARAGVNAAIIPADARWLIYADLNALRASAIGKELIAMAEKAQVETPAGKVGVDWQKLLATIGTTTAYGTNLSPDPKDVDGTLVVQGTPDLRKIAESILIQANLANPNDVTELTDLPFPAYSLKDSKAKPAKAAKETEPAAEAKAAKPKKPAAPLEIIVAFPPEPIVIVSKAKAQILKAREVFRGSAPSLAKASNSPLAKFLRGSDGAYLFAASTVPTDKFFKEDDGPQARILKMANAGATTVGERGPDVYLHAELVASSGQSADKMMKILQGLTAMMSLAETNDKALADFLNSAAVNRAGDVVTLDLSYASARLAQMIKSLQQPPKPPGRPENILVSGTAVAQWTAEAAPATPDGQPTEIALGTRTIENVALKNGSTITLGRANVHSGNIRFERVEITPVTGGGAALIFNAPMLRTGGPRGNWQQIQFPGADGTYALKVVYKNDPSGQATYAVSVRDPRTEPAPAPSPGPIVPQPKIK